MLFAAATLIRKTDWCEDEPWWISRNLACMQLYAARQERSGILVFEFMSTSLEQ